MNVKDVDRYIRNTLKKRRLEQELKRLKDELEKEEARLTDYFTTEAVQNIKTEHGLAYLDRSVFASLAPEPDGEHKRAHAALRRAGLGYMVKNKVNPQTLSAYVREQESLEQELPKTLLRHINVAEVFRVRVRSA